MIKYGTKITDAIQIDQEIQEVRKAICNLHSWINARTRREKSAKNEILMATKLSVVALFVPIMEQCKDDIAQYTIAIENANDYLSGKMDWKDVSLALKTCIQFISVGDIPHV